MNTTSTLKRPRRPLSRIDLGILALHGLAAVIVGVNGFLDVSEGWEALQRIVVAMMVALWFAGIVAMGYLARIVFNPWLRMAILLAGPLVGIAALVLQAQA